MSSLEDYKREVNKIKAEHSLEIQGLRDELTAKMEAAISDKNTLIADVSLNKIS